VKSSALVIQPLESAPDQAQNEPGLVLTDVNSAGPQSLAWFCLKSQPKHEHIAAAHIRREMELEVFLPRIRFKRSSRTGSVWVTEALFPGYLFARFDLRESLRRVQSCRGVRGVVHFGSRWPTIPDAAVRELKLRIGDETVRVLTPEFQPGDRVRISGGAFHGLEALVSKLLSGRERVAVLLEFLGQQTTVEVSREALLPAQEQRKAIFDGAAEPSPAD
jgi:transcriptional antiterminator RfaH